MIAFIRRYENAELELPYTNTEAQRVSDVLGRLRDNIRIAISSQAILPSRWSELVSLARRIEGASQTEKRPEKRSSATAWGESRRCFKCDQEGHIARNCPSEKATQAPQESRGGAAREGAGKGEPHCYNCKQTGHLANACTAPRRNACFSCGEEGHYAGACPNIKCRNCGRRGHTAARCTAISNVNSEPVTSRGT